MSFSVKKSYLHLMLSLPLFAGCTGRFETRPLVPVKVLQTDTSKNQPKQTPPKDSPQPNNDKKVDQTPQRNDQPSDQNPAGDKNNPPAQQQPQTQQQPPAQQQPQPGKIEQSGQPAQPTADANARSEGNSAGGMLDQLKGKFNGDPIVIGQKTGKKEEAPAAPGAEKDEKRDEKKAENKDDKKDLSFEEAVKNCDRLTDFEKDLYLENPCEGDLERLKVICSPPENSNKLKNKPVADEDEKNNKNANDYLICSHDTFEPKNKDHIKAICDDPPRFEPSDTSFMTKIFAKTFTTKDQLVPITLALSCQLKAKTCHENEKGEIECDQKAYPMTMDTITGQRERYYVTQMTPERVDGCVIKETYEPGPKVCPKTMELYQSFKKRSVDENAATIESDNKACLEAATKSPTACQDRRSCAGIYKRRKDYKADFGSFLTTITLYEYLKWDHDLCATASNDCSKPAMTFDKQQLEEQQERLGRLFYKLDVIKYKRYKQYCPANN